MKREIRAAGAAERYMARLVVGVALLGLSAQGLLAVSCSVVKHGEPSEADKALLAADYAKAEGLYQADLAKKAGDPELTAGLVHALLREQKLTQAAEVVKTALAATPGSAALITLRGEVELRQGEPWTAEQSVVAAYKLDPCNARTRLLFARISQLKANYATAKQQIQLAHQFDPADPEISWAWIQTLPAAQRVTETEAYLSAPNGLDTVTVGILRANLARDKKLTAEPARACSLSSTAGADEIPFIRLAGFGWGGHSRGPGLEATVNGALSRLQLGADEGGITVFRPLAERAGLKRITDSEKSLMPGGKPSYLAYADSIKIGKLEFKNCTVKVIESGTPFDDGDGSIGIDAFADFLMTIDYPLRKLQLGPLPEKTPPAPVASPALRTNPTDTMYAANEGLSDRYIAPEMKDYSQIYRFGPGLLFPTAMNTNKMKLMALNIGSDGTSVSTEAAKEVSKTYEKAAEGPQGGKILVADAITFNFAHVVQKLNGVKAMDTGIFSKILGTELSGFIGRDVFQVLVMHIDYRDGLVKFEYIQNHGFPKYD